MANPDRLSGLDASFLHLERDGAHMHVASVALYAGPAPAYTDFVAQTESRLHLVPRYRQKLRFVPLDQGRPVWTDDPHFNPGYHIRHTALPAPAGMEELKRLAGRVLSQQLDRSKPLWEMWLVDRVERGDGEEHFALISKTHHALVDGVSGVDLMTVMFDLSPDPPPTVEPAEPWIPRPEPTSAKLLADALSERAGGQLDLARQATGALRAPARAATAAGGAAAGLASLLGAGLSAPSSPLNARIGPHRRFTWVEAELARFKAIKSALGGTVNDVVLAAVTGALRSWYERNGHSTDGVVLRAMVPVSVRAEAERGALGNRVATMYAPLPVDEADPLARFRTVHEAMRGLKESGQAVGAEILTRLTGFAPPTIVAQAARLQSRQRLFNLTVTNVPGPQFPLYMAGRRMEALYPQVPLAAGCALGIAIMSYDGNLDFGLVADYDVLPDVEAVADGLRESIEELAEAARAGTPKRRATASRREGAQRR